METYTPDYQRNIFNAPSVRREWCVVCGRPAQNDHHVIPGHRHKTKNYPESPTLSLCGMGNASGCHGLAHSHKLHFRAVPVEILLFGGMRKTVLEWEYLITDEPVKEQDAQELDGWKVIRT